MEKELKIAAFIANLLDNQFNFMGKRFGLNGVLGLVPGGGDIATLALSTYLITIAFKSGMPLPKIMVMIWNVILNFLVGLVPVLGDFFDFFTSANLKNLKILQDHVRNNPIVEGEVVDARN